MRSAIFIIVSLLVVATALAQTTRSANPNAASATAATISTAPEPMLISATPPPVAKPKKKAIREDYSMESQMLQRGEGRITGSSKLKYQPYRKELYSGVKSSIGNTPYRPTGAKSLVTTKCKLGTSTNSCK